MRFVKHINFHDMTITESTKKQSSPSKSHSSFCSSSLGITVFPTAPQPTFPSVSQSLGRLLIANSKQVTVRRGGES